MSSRTYTSLEDVKRDTELGIFANESELRQTFIEALKSELRRCCPPQLVDYALAVMIDRCIEQSRKKPDIRLLAFSNLVIEVEPPKASLERGRNQLLNDYIPRLLQKLQSRGLTIHGIVTNGVEAEHWVFNENGPKREAEGEMPQVVRQVLYRFCSEKITILTPEDLVAILGV
jgi:hypothetical protein